MKLTERTAPDHRADRAAAARARAAQCSFCLRQDQPLDRHGRCADRRSCERIAPPMFPAEAG